MRKLMHCLIFLASLPLEAQLANLVPKHSPSEPDVERLRPTMLPDLRDALPHGFDGATRLRIAKLSTSIAVLRACYETLQPVPVRMSPRS